MRTSVTFRHPAEFVPVSEVDGVLDVSGAEWFAELSRGIPDLELDESPFQEDWGVLFFVRRAGCRFSIGLSAWHANDWWLVDVRHDGWLQGLRRAGKEGLKRLLSDLHLALTEDAAVSDVAWYDAGLRNGASRTPFDA